MNFLNVDFAKGTTALFKEAFKFKKYKAMPTFFAIVVGICQIPFVLISFITAAIVYVLNFFIKIIAYPVEQIHGVVRNEKDEVKAGAQTVIYLVSWPMIFILYSAIIFSTFMLNILYIFVSLSTFIWSLGGFRFHLLLGDAKDIEKNVEGKYNNIVLIAFVVVLAILLVAAFVLPTVLTKIEYNNQLEEYLVSVLGPQYEQAAPELLAQYEISFENSNYENIKFDVAAKFNMLTFLPDVFVFLYTLIAFVPFPKKKAEEEASAVAEVIAESVVDEPANEEVATEEVVAEEEATAVDSEEKETSWTE